jgi:excisionase family DNA binding protein
MGGQKTMENLEKLLGPKEIAEILNFRRSKIHRMLASGEIPSVIVAQGTKRRVFRVRPSALLQWMKRREISQHQDKAGA